MRITKEAACKVADGLTSKKNEQIEKISGEIKAFATEIARKNTPKDILELFDKRSGHDWFYTSSSLKMVGNGLNHESVDIHPTPSDGSFHITVEPNQQQATKMIRLLKVRDILSKQKKELYREIYNAIMSLGTYARITEKFPEAIPFLPTKEKAELAINISDIRKKLLV